MIVVRNFILRVHGFILRGQLCPRVLRPATRALRHRHVSGTRKLRRGDDRGYRLGRSF